MVVVYGYGILIACMILGLPYLLPFGMVGNVESKSSTVKENELGALDLFQIYHHYLSNFYSIDDNRHTFSSPSFQNLNQKLSLQDQSNRLGSGDICIPSFGQFGGDCLLQYENYTYGIKLAYPSSWKPYVPKNNAANNDSLFVAGFVEPTTGAYILVGVEKTILEQSPSTYLAKVIQDYSSQVQGFTLISSDLSQTYIAGVHGYEIFYTSTGKAPDKAILTREVGTVVPGTNLAYYVTYSADSSVFSKLEDDVQKMVDSLELHLHNVDAKPPTDLADLDSLTLYDGAIL